MKFQTLDDVNVKSKTVFVRVDLNCPIKNGKPQVSARVSAHAKTLFLLSKKGAKTVVLAHQGRKGKDDFISLAPHAKMLEKEINKISKPNKIKVEFIADVCGAPAQGAIKKLKDGQILLLENTRFLDDEETFEKDKKSDLVKNLFPLCEVFVLDAFSVAHRSHASVCGFAKCAHVVAGPIMAEELSALCNLEKPKKPALLVIGGAKPSDSLPIMKQWLEQGKADSVLCGGAMANLMLFASGKSLGKPSEDFLQKNEALQNFEQTKKLYAKYKSKIIIPSDVIVDNLGKAKVVDSAFLPSDFAILDIGPETARSYAKLISCAGSIVLNGPMGVYEKVQFSSGTKTVLGAVAKSGAFSLLGGGHTLSALEEFNIPYSKFGYVSLSGKALIEFLSGDELPGVKMLEH